VQDAAENSSRLNCSCADLFRGPANLDDFVRSGGRCDWGRRSSFGSDCSPVPVVRYVTRNLKDEDSEP
jgi:hypothetical protein